MRVLLVANARSRGGAAARHLPAVTEALSRRASVEILPATLETTRAVADRLRGRAWDRVVALGGDGTFARVADGVLLSGVQVPLAILPAGLANNHARGLHIPTIYEDLETAVEAVFADRSLQMDVGVLAGDGQGYFYDTLGFGFQASVLGHRERLRHLPGLGGELGYAVATGMQLARRHRFGVAGRWDGLLDLIVSNSVWYGGRWVLDRQARPDDGLLELVAVRGWRDLVRHAWPGGQADERLASIELDFDRAVPSQVDGETGPVGRHFEITLRPGALTVVGDQPSPARAPSR